MSPAYVTPLFRPMGHSSREIVMAFNRSRIALLARRFRIKNISNIATKGGKAS
jgi:hypothetical protein